MFLSDYYLIYRSKKGYVPILFLMSDKYYNNFVSENKLIRELWLKN